MRKLIFAILTIIFMSLVATGCGEDCICEEENDEVRDLTISGEYLYFDGDNNYVEIRDTPKLSGGLGKDLTIELWAYPKSYGEENRRCMITKYLNWNNKEWGLFIEIAGKEEKQIDGAIAFQKETWSMPGTPHGNWYAWSSEAIPLEQWTHVAAVFDNDRDVVSIYINGMFSGSRDLTGDLTDSNAAVWIGGPGNFYYQIDGREMFHGYIDDVRVWDIVRTETEISNNMFVGSISDSESGLVAYWDFERGENLDILYDHSGNDHHGEIVGATWEDENPPPSMSQR